jgi:quinol monooxygenase YgiN
VIYAVVTFTIKPGTLEPFVDAAVPTIEATRRETGCILYDLLASVTDPERVVFLEQWESREALTLHSAAPHVADFKAASQPFVVSSRMEIIHPDFTELL